MILFFNFQFLIDKNYLDTIFFGINRGYSVVNSSTNIFSNNFLFSTLLLPNPTPKASDWWYYGQEHGQHISFYRVKTLEHIAHKFGKNLSTNRHNYHLIGDKKINYITFKILIKFCTLHNFLIKSDQKYLKNDYLKNINQ